MASGRDNSVPWHRRLSQFLRLSATPGKRRDNGAEDENHEITSVHSDLGDLASCHTQSTRVSVPSHSSTHSSSSTHSLTTSIDTTSCYSDMRYLPRYGYPVDNCDMPRYGYPYTAEMPVLRQHNHYKTEVPSPISLDLAKQQIPAIQVQPPTPVMINTPNRPLEVRIDYV